MSKKHYKIVVTVEAPYPVEFVYREDANWIRAAVGRALAKFRDDMAGKPITELTIHIRKKDIVAALAGRPDVKREGDESVRAVVDGADVDEEEIDDDEEVEDETDVEEQEEKNKNPTKEFMESIKTAEIIDDLDAVEELIHASKIIGKPEIRRLLKELENKREELSDMEEEPESKEEEENEEEETEEEPEEEEEEETEETTDDDEGLAYDDLIAEIKKAKDQKRIDMIVAKYITPFEWSTDETEAFDEEIGKIKDSWDDDRGVEEEKPKTEKKPTKLKDLFKEKEKEESEEKLKKVPGKSAFDNVMAMAGKNKKKK